jgi:hypothetical protein
VAPDGSFQAMLLRSGRDDSALRLPGGAGHSSLAPATSTGRNRATRRRRTPAAPPIDRGHSWHDEKPSGGLESAASCFAGRGRKDAFQPAAARHHFSATSMPLVF